jgi:hypothetical protein
MVHGAWCMVHQQMQAQMHKKQDDAFGSHARVPMYLAVAWLPTPAFVCCMKIENENENENTKGRTGGTFGSSLYRWKRGQHSAFGHMKLQLQLQISTVLLLLLLIVMFCLFVCLCLFVFVCLFVCVCVFCFCFVCKVLKCLIMPHPRV